MPHSPKLQALAPAVERSLRAQVAWFHHMRHPTDDLIAYEYLPTEGRHVFKRSPIRELGTMATLGALSSWSGVAEFDDVISAILGRYEAILVREDRGNPAEGPLTAEDLGGMETDPELALPSQPFSYLNSTPLGEPSSIAHSAMMILALLSHEKYPQESRKEELLTELARGIVRQQAKSGTFRIHFDVAHGLPNSGWELYSGEAELALGKSYTRLGDWHLLRSASRAFAAYIHAFEAGKVPGRSSVFFANWQCQAGRVLVQHTTAEEKLRGLVDKMCSMQDGVIKERQLFLQAEEAPQEASVVEVACGLEGVLHTYAAVASCSASVVPKGAKLWVSMTSK